MGYVAHVGEAAAIGGGFVEEDAVNVNVLVVIAGTAGCRPVLVGRDVVLNGGLGLRADADVLAVAAASGRCGRMDYRRRRVLATWSCMSHICLLLLRLTVAESLDVGDCVEVGDGVDVACIVAVRTSRGTWTRIGIDDNLECHIWMIVGGIIKRLPGRWGLWVDVEGHFSMSGVVGRIALDLKISDLRSTKA